MIDRLKMYGDRVLSPETLTPVQNIGGLLIKRDDLYMPFGEGEVNGGKLRQCLMLVDSIKNQYNGVISCCSIHSPQAPITAATARYFHMPCFIYYGGTSKETLLQLPMPQLCLKYGANIKIAAKSGRHNILYSKARKIAQELHYFTVEYGINLNGHSDVLFGAVSRQVENIPNELDNLVITCGSGITSTGVLLGLAKYGKKVKNIHLVATAPDRRRFITDNVSHFGVKAKFEYHDLFHRKGFVYEKGLKAIFGGIQFHPNYEAKTLSWLMNESGIDYQNEKTLLWVVGSEPKGRKNNGI